MATGPTGYADILAPELGREGQRIAAGRNRGPA
jgi:hypothetical protein